jgi:hypothetical protein
MTPALSRALRIIIPAAMLAMTGGPVHAQEVVRETEAAGAGRDSVLRTNAASVLFDKNLNTFNWIGRLAVDTVAGRMRFGIGATYLSNIIQTENPLPGAIRSSESTQQNFRLMLAQPVSDPLALHTQWSSLIFSDNRGYGLSNASNHTLLAGLDVTPWPFVTFSPLAGYRWDRQGAIRDRGLALDLGAEIHPLDLDGYRFSGVGHFRRDNLSPRVLTNHIAQAGVEKRFSPESRDSLVLSFQQTGREFYLAGDSTIESRVDNLFSFANLLSYDVSRSLGADLFVNVHNRGLDKDTRRLRSDPAAATTFDTRIEEFRMDAYAQVWYHSPDANTSAHLRLGYSERSETHSAKAPAGTMPANIAVQFAERNRQEQSKDNVARRVSLTGGSSLPLSSLDRIMFAGSATILRYDTPSELNQEDRDELLVALALGTWHRLSRHVDIGISLDGTFSHLVYLLKERSANNNINRVLRLSPRAIYRPADWFTSINGFEVLANYTVYDYEKQVALARSFSYRQFSWMDSTAVELTQRIGLDFYAYLKLYERGILRWDEFLERTENSTVDRTFSAQVRYAPGPSLLVALGVRYFSQSRYIYKDTIRRPDTFFSSVGPTSLIRWDIGATSRLLFQGWYERRKQSDGTFRSLASMMMHVFLHF